MTFSAWISCSTLPKSAQTVFGFNNILARADTLVGSDGKISFYTVWNSATVFWKTDNAVITTDGSWHHIMIAYDATATSNDPVIYVNGELKAITENGTAPASSWGGVDRGSDDIFTIGDGYGSTNWTGHIDEVAIWNRILDLGAAEKIYNAGRADSLYVTGLDSDVQAWYRMGDGLDVPLKIHDVSGNGRPGGS